MTRRIRLDWLLTFLGLGFLAAALAVGWDDVVSEFRWSAARFVGATVVSVGALLAVAASWASLHPRATRRFSFLRYLIVQPAKHIPGGIAHPIGLISSSTREVPLSRSTANFFRFSLISLASGLAVGGSLTFNPGTRLVGMLSYLGAVVVAALVLNRKFGSRLEDWLPRVTKRFVQTRFDNPSDRVPKQNVVWSLAWGVVGLSGLSAAFGILAAVSIGMPTFLVLTGAFGLAWSIGYSLAPVPAGIGVREAVLVAILVGIAPSGPILAAALLQRLSQVLAEVVTVLVGLAATRRRKRSIADQSLP